MAKETPNQNQAAMVPASADVSAKIAAMSTGWSTDSLLKDGFTSEFIFGFKEKGQRIRGIFIGQGLDVVLSEKTAERDEETGELTSKKTWLIQNGNVTARVLGSHELDGFFGSKEPGCEVAIEYIGMEDLYGGSQRVKRFNMLSKNAKTKPAATEARIPQGNSGGAHASS